MNTEKHESFLGTYFNKEIVQKLEAAARLFSWIIAGFYSLQWLLQIGTFILQYARGFWTNMGFTDVAQNIIWLCEQPLRGLVYFIVLQGVAQALLIFMDIEDNTRRAANSVGRK